MVIMCMICDTYICYALFCSTKQNEWKKLLQLVIIRTLSKYIYNVYIMYFMN